MAIGGVSHIGLTVTDLDRSGDWYRRVLDWTERARGRGDTSAYAYGTLPGGLTLVLRQHDTGADGPFAETRPGLDHLSLAVESPADFDDLERRLRDAGTVFTPRADLPGMSVLAFRDPDNIALEAFLPS
jgi:catechol 2,3-dioxygenase-like lactoylglutathione lyase family enzyme